VTKHKPTPHEPPADEAKPQAENAADTTPQPAAAPAQDSAAQLRAELQAAKDRELRCHAELDNFRKRAARELEDRLRYADMSLLRDLVPVLDDVERAIQAAQQNAEANALLDGFKMVQQHLEEVLKRHHCRRIEALGAPFDPHLHHAMMQQASNEHPANTVLMVTQNGYQLHDRVVRPSQVIVSTEAAQESTPESP
jgi:molecular chaperone GrpE